MPDKTAPEGTLHFRLPRGIDADPLKADIAALKSQGKKVMISLGGGGEYFKLTDSKSLERDLGTISNHMPNRYILSFQPQSPHPGLHAVALSAPSYSKLQVTARTSYWADPEGTPSTLH